MKWALENYKNKKKPQLSVISLKKLQKMDFSIHTLYVTQLNNFIFYKQASNNDSSNVTKVGAHRK